MSSQSSDSGRLCPLCLSFDWDALERRPMNGDTFSRLSESAADGCYTCRILKKTILTFFNVRNPARFRFGFTVRKYGSASNDSDGEHEGRDRRLIPELKVWDIDQNRPADGIDLYKTGGKNICSSQDNLFTGQIRLANSARWAMSMAICGGKASCT